MTALLDRFDHEDGVELRVVGVDHVHDAQIRLPGRRVDDTAARPIRTAEFRRAESFTVSRDELEVGDAGGGYR